MKKCEHFKELILTDYIDGQLDKDASGTLESHLFDCGDCRAFLKEVKNNATLPFIQATRQPVPEGLWEAVREKIEHENHSTDPLADLIDKLRGMITFPRFVPVFASFILMFLAGSMTLNTIQIQQAQAKDQGEYLVALLNPAGSPLQGDNNDLGTPIEHYFL